MLTYSGLGWGLVLGEPGSSSWRYTAFHCARVAGRIGQDRHRAPLQHTDTATDTCCSSSRKMHPYGVEYTSPLRRRESSRLTHGPAVANTLERRSCFFSFVCRFCESSGVVQCSFLPPPLQQKGVYFDKNFSTSFSDRDHRRKSLLNLFL